MCIGDASFSKRETTTSSAYVARRQHRQSDDYIWTTDVAVQTAATDYDNNYDYYKLVATNDDELQQLTDLMAADDDNMADDTLYVAVDRGCPSWGNDACCVIEIQGRKSRLKFCIM